MYDDGDEDGYNFLVVDLNVDQAASDFFAKKGVVHRLVLLPALGSDWRSLRCEAIRMQQALP